DRHQPEHDTHQQGLELIVHPGAKSLRCQAILVFANIALVISDRKAKNKSQSKIFDPVNDSVNWHEARDALSEITHSRRPARMEEKRRDKKPINKIQQNYQKSAFEIAVKAAATGGG